MLFIDRFSLDIRNEKSQFTEKLNTKAERKRLSFGIFYDHI